MFKTIALTLGLLTAMAAGPASAQSLKQLDCSAVKKQPDGLYLVLKDTSIVDASANTFNVSKGSAIGPSSMVSNGVSIFDLIDEQCSAPAASPSAAAAATGSAPYVYVDAGKPGGPLGAADLAAKLSAGTLPPDTPVWTPALSRWTPANQVADLGAAAALGAGPAKSPDCGGGRAVYDDKFVDDSGGFGVSPGRASAINGAFQINLSPKLENWAAINVKRTQADGDYCLEAAWPATSGDEVVSAGLAVLAVDANTFYLGQISSNGHIGLYRRDAGHWSDLYATDDASALNMQAGAYNAVRLVVKAGQVTMSVNGARVAEARVEIPATPRFGVYVQVDGEQIPPDVPVRFRHYRVAAP